MTDYSTVITRMLDTMIHVMMAVGSPTAPVATTTGAVVMMTAFVAVDMTMMGAVLGTTLVGRMTDLFLL